MAIAVTTLSTADNGSGSTLPLTGVTFPSTALVVVFVSENGPVSPGSVSDGVNNYSLITSQAPGGGGRLTQIFYAWNVTGISGGTITFNKNGTSNCAMSALYATGIQSSSSPLLSAVTNSASGALSIHPTVTANFPPPIAGDLFIGAVGWNTSAATFTQDTNLPWSNPFDVNTNRLTNQIGGGYYVNPTLNAISYSPTLNVSDNWAAIIVAFAQLLPPPSVGFAGLAASEW